MAGVDPGVIHPFAVVGPDGQGLLVSGRAIRAENHLHLADAKRRARATARRAPKPGQAGSRPWRQARARQRKQEAVHRRRVAQAHHEAAAAVIAWSVQRRVGTLRIGDPRGCWPWTPGGGTTSGSATGASGTSWPACATRPSRLASPPCWSMSGAPPRPARPAPGGHRSAPGARSPARTAGSPGTATSSAAPTSPPAPRAADPSSPENLARSRTGSRTAAPGTTCQVCPRHDVTPGAAPIPAAPAGPLAGRGPPHPDVGTSLAHRPRRHARIA